MSYATAGEVFRAEIDAIKSAGTWKEERLIGSPQGVEIDVGGLEARLREAADARLRLVVTDGVFSMDGDEAPLRGICALAERHDALVMVDDSHASGFLGPTGRGTAEKQGVADRIDILTST